MSTNANSAKQWVLQNKPDTQTIIGFIKKLEGRLESMEPDHPSWDGNEEALAYLQSLLEKNTTTDNPKVDVNLGNSTVQVDLDVSSLHDNSSVTTNWDVSSLTPDVQTKPELPEDQKRALFEQLKKQVQ
ncbi:hypothetical protein [Marinicellulosiphila megalodicopiae]|uniref:hypothetical protein n=1 Tax=Marinicellulosiphila megalodicopiae TaxID=2724896 RepID=UPI003BB17449